MKILKPNKSAKPIYLGPSNNWVQAIYRVPDEHDGSMARLFNSIQFLLVKHRSTRLHFQDVSALESQNRRKLNNRFLRLIVTVHLISFLFSTFITCLLIDMFPCTAKGVVLNN